MKSTSKIREGAEERIQDRIAKMKLRRGHFYFRTHLAYPESQKRLSQGTISQSIIKIEAYLPSIKTLIKGLRVYIPHIWDQNTLTAVYLLLGKAYMDLSAITSLAKEGYCFEMVEISRSAQESIDLAFAFFEKRDEVMLEKWFSGKFVKNETARKAFDMAINSMKKDNNGLPVELIKSDIYRIQSSYTHSCYSALLDLVDVFHEDFDFDKHAGFHYTARYLYILKDLAVKILLQLKSVYSKYNDFPKVQEIDNLLTEIGFKNISQEELTSVLNQYPVE